MLRDSKAPHFWRREQIADIAAEHREMSSLRYFPNASMCSFILNELPDIIGQKFEVRVRSLDEAKGYPAYVAFKPVRLVVDQDVWEAAKLGDVESIYILAHEAGHLNFHSKHQVHFSSQSENFEKWTFEENSTEWQAHQYAQYLLFPDRFSEIFSDPQEAADALGVPLWLARQRVAEYKEKQRRSELAKLSVKDMMVAVKRYEGDFCPRCNNFSLIREGYSIRCEGCEMEMKK